jgi:ABC-2 type transport system permease protein
MSGAGSAGVTAPAPDGETLDVSGTPPVPFHRLVTVELRKMTDTRSGKWLLITIAVITALAVGLVMVFAHDQDKVFETYIGIAATPQGFLLPVLGVLLVTSEWGQRAGMTTFTLEPRRSRVLAAKVVAAVVFGLAAIVVALLLATLATLVANQPDRWGDYQVGDFGKFALLQTMGILQGLAFGMIFLNSAAAIVTYFVVPIAFSVVTGVVPHLQHIQPWVDLNTSQQPLFGGASLSGQEWAQLATGTLIWIVLPLVLGAWRMLHAEVK